MNYYRTIDGQEYDRRLIELAESFTQGQGDGRISVEDAQQLIQATRDGGSVTRIEILTISYTFEIFNWTEAALDWLNQQQILIDPNAFERESRRILRSYDLGQMELIASVDLVAQMHTQYEGQLRYFEAVRAALTAIFETFEAGTPGGEVATIIHNLYDLWEVDFVDPAKWRGFVHGMLRERMNKGAFILIPIYEKVSEEALPAPAPDNREPSAQYWNFFLDIVTDDHQFWVVVDRTGSKPPSVYGLN